MTDPIPEGPHCPECFGIGGSLCQSTGINPWRTVESLCKSCRHYQTKCSGLVSDGYWTWRTPELMLNKDPQLARAATLNGATITEAQPGQCRFHKAKDKTRGNHD